MEKEYKAYKLELDSLLKNIEEINHEALRFTDTNNSLKELSKQLSKLCEKFSDEIQKSNKMLEVVNSFASKNTIDHITTLNEQNVAQIKLLENITKQNEEQLSKLKEDNDKNIQNIETKFKAIIFTIIIVALIIIAAVYFLKA